LLLIFDPSYEFHRIGKNNQAGPGEIQLAASRDLLNWRRLGDRRPFIPRGEPGEFDWASAWYASGPIVKDDKLWFYYTGNCTTHAGTRDNDYWNRLLARVESGELPGACSIGLATLRRDGFVSLDAGETPGTLLTNVFRWPDQGRLHINTDAAGGEVRVAVCQPDGTPYRGYEQSEPLTGDQPDACLRWQRPTKVSNGPRHTHGTEAEAGAVDPADVEVLIGGKPARLRISARRAALYSYWITE
jgi:hypothetical protein